MNAEHLTTSEVAERLNAADRTVRLWCKRGLFPNAFEQQSPRGSYWLIPASDLSGFTPPPMGRPKKAAPANGAGKKKGGRK